MAALTLGSTLETGLCEVVIGISTETGSAVAVRTSWRTDSDLSIHKHAREGAIPLIIEQSLRLTQLCDVDHFG